MRTDHLFKWGDRVEDGEVQWKRVFCMKRKDPAGRYLCEEEFMHLLPRDRVYDRVALRIQLHALIDDKGRDIVFGAESCVDIARCGGQRDGPPLHISRAERRDARTL